MRCTAVAALRGAGNEQGFQGVERFGRVSTQAFKRDAQLRGVVGEQPGFQFVAEAGPWNGEMHLQLMVHGWVDDLASLQVDEALPYGLQFLAPGVVGHALDHAVAARGDYGGIQGVMPVAVAAQLQQAPTGAQ